MVSAAMSSLTGERVDRSRGCVIYHLGRMGSTVLADMLDHLPNVISDSEIYTDYQEKENLSRRFPDALEYTRAKVKSHFRLLRAGGVYLFECKFADSVDMRHFPFGIDGYVDLVRSLGMRHAIVLRRRNILRRFVSSKLARESGSYQRRRGEKAALPRIRLNVHGIGFGPRSYPLLDAIRLVEDEYGCLERALARHGIEWLDLTYEDDIEGNPAVAFNKACHYLQLQAIDVAPRYERINSRPVQEIVANFDQVAGILRGTPHEWMLEA
jgi:hypothetical protein